MQTTNQIPTLAERKLAILAHASILITFLVAITTGGIGVLAAILVPFFIWYLNRERSSYVAFHALQATMYQIALVGIFLSAGAVICLVLGLVWLITAVLSILLIGLILVPIAAVFTVIVALVLTAYPLAGLTYGLTAAWQVYNTDTFRYPWIADWLENRL
jgi:uncharacterized Tic20 family protein